MWRRVDPNVVTRPMLLVQGLDDRRVNPKRVSKFTDKAVEAGAPVTLVELAGLGHDLDWDDKSVFPIVRAFLTGCLEVDPPPAESP